MTMMLIRIIRTTISNDDTKQHMYTSRDLKMALN